MLTTRHLGQVAGDVKRAPIRVMSESNHTCRGCREILARLEALVPLLESILPQSGSCEILDAAGVAERYALSRRWVYEHKDELGGWPVGDGPRPRWRFEVAEVEAALRGSSPEPQRAKPRRRRPTNGTTPLLPIRGGERS